MAQIQKLEFQTELKCPADKFYGMFKQNLTQLTKYFPETYESIQVIEGDGPSVGSVRFWNYELDGQSFTCKDRTMVVDDEKRSMIWSIFEGEVMNLYNTLELKLQVSTSPKGKGSLVKWTVEFEKANEDAPIPTAYINLTERISKGMDLHLLKQA
ncbi:Bet v I domain [Macleaya cordata]|uniref:Bet v I domain n=1 Tax=Macleaya cordata TaxID=56857 RepID=A0A200PU47_MACCD|nr:Bet v I domain [Macleaya cordata]